MLHKLVKYLNNATSPSGAKKILKRMTMLLTKMKRLVTKPHIFKTNGLFIYTYYNKL